VDGKEKKSNNMKNNIIRIKGARQHNLKNVDVDIPKNKLVVFTGVSGSGKSSLAFDTIYAEGQRRYVESLSTYARQFLGIMEKPDVDLIEGLSPAISIDQKTTSKNPRSTVGTITEVYDYMRLLFSRIGHPHCPICGREISNQSLDQIVSSVMDLINNSLKTNKKFMFLVLSPVVSDKKGEFSALFDNLRAKGYKQIRIDNFVKDLSDSLVLIKTNKHNIDVIVDKLSVTKSGYKKKIFKENLKSRLSESIEQSLKLSDGLLIIAEILDKSFALPDYPKTFSDHLFSERFACPVDNIQLPEIEPRTFSFNSPHGACPGCSGIGKILKVDPSIVLSKEISIKEGAIIPFSNMFEHDTWYSRLILKVCDENSIDPKIQLKHLSDDQINIILYGTGDKEYRVEGTNRFGKLTQIYDVFSGVIFEMERRHAKTDSDWVRNEVEKYMKEQICADCSGFRLKKESLGVTINNRSISDITKLSIDKAIEWFSKLNSINSSLNEREIYISKLIIKEIVDRLKFLQSVGLSYLTIDRPAGSLSGGEAQRIRLASQIGSGLTGVLYVLDEPTIGLHAKDNQRLIDTLKRLRDLGNTIIVVEHDYEMINQSDHVIDFGPGAGKIGGKVVISGDPSKIKKSRSSITGKYLSGRKKVEVGNVKNEPLINDQGTLNIIGCSQFNLKNINVDFPIGKFVVITGVSGSGKSTLLVDTLYPAIKQILTPFYRGRIGSYKNIKGSENIEKVILIDQSPIGRTPRSNPATYTKVFDHIRDVFSQTHDARSLGFKKGRFSFNVKGGRCDSCDGQGQIKIEMQFMSDIWITCDICGGKRYNAQTLDVVYKGKNISDILSMTVSEAKEFFHSHSKIIRIFETLESVGLNYMELGQSATTLSGGEAQRVKLSTELSKISRGNNIYILDEPTTGLHFADVEKLLLVLKTLVYKGNSVYVIEHNMDIIKNADWIIDLGPGGGDDGGNVIAYGNIKDIINKKESYTGRCLNKIMNTIHV
jgi:excinuclease ABC subunit A